VNYVNSKLVLPLALTSVHSKRILCYVYNTPCPPALTAVHDQYCVMCTILCHVYTVKYYKIGSRGLLKPPRLFMYCLYFLFGCLNIPLALVEPSVFLPLVVSKPLKPISLLICSSSRLLSSSSAAANTGSSMSSSTGTSGLGLGLVFFFKLLT